MSTQYQVIARKYRPQLFSDVVGHAAILQTLKNSIQRGTVAHAYLFSGQRGVGKTTLARLFAKTLNCMSLSTNFEPCNQCASCLDVMSSQSLDVIEIDGASNRGIDDIRQINETVLFAPSHGKYKITIIDEVHMLTKEAFNALLKTLEEPPARAKFFFATTELHKVPSTILSRCQRFDLSRLSTDQIISKLEQIAQDLKRSAEINALHLLAKASDGSLRDAESLFDQVLCFANGPVTEADARNVLGLMPAELFWELDLAFKESRVSYAFELTEHLFQSGIASSQFLSQLIEHYRHLLVCKTLSADSLKMPPELAAKYAASSQFYTQQQCFAALDLCLKTESTFSKTLAPRTAIELLLLQILRTKNRIPIEVLVRRLSDLEEAITQGKPIEKGPEPAPVEAKPELQPVLEVQAGSVAVPKPEIVVQTPALSLTATKPVLPDAIAPQPSVPKAENKMTPKHPSHYDTLIRFAAVELEGTVVKT